VTFVKEGGERVVRIAAPDPLLGVSDLKADLLRRAALKPAHPLPGGVVAVGRPGDEPALAPKSYERERDNIGAGPEPHKLTLPRHPLCSQRVARAEILIVLGWLGPSP
jgi:hypothetical protein